MRSLREAVDLLFSQPLPGPLPDAPTVAHLDLVDDRVEVERYADAVRALRASPVWADLCVILEGLECGQQETLLALPPEACGEIAKQQAYVRLSRVVRRLPEVLLGQAEARVAELISVEEGVNG